MAHKTKIIYRDGKRYEFTPGANGSFIHRGTPSDPTMAKGFPPVKQAKSIGPRPGSEQMMAGTQKPKRIAKVIRKEPAMPRLAMRQGKFDLEDRQ